MNEHIILGILNALPYSFTSLYIFNFIESKHVFYAFLFNCFYGVLNYIIEHIFTKYLPKIQNTSINIINNNKYANYIITNIILTILFTSWFFAYIPLLENIDWSNDSITVKNTIMSYLGSLLLYDFIYYFGHLGMHKIKLINENIHSIHHQIHSPSNLQHSLYIHPLEFFYFIWLQIVPMYTFNFHIIGVFMYIGTIFCVTAMYHSGINIPNLPYILSVSAHNKHHQFRLCNYSFFSEIPDLIFKTLI